MKTSKTIGIALGLLAATAAFLLLESLLRWEFLWHVAAIPLDILIAVLIVEKYIEHREIKAKRQQLMYIKSYMFRSELRNLYLADFAALKNPPITMARIRNASPAELKEMRRQAESIEYKSLEALEPVIEEYVKAEQAWHTFKERAITYNFEDIFLNMIAILHFIYDVKGFKAKHPRTPYIHEAAANEESMKKVWKILTDGIKFFLNYAIELKDKQPAIFEEMMADYELAMHIRQTS
jgi:hypothetical protein